jgi:hypothetical protein
MTQTIAFQMKQDVANNGSVDLSPEFIDSHQLQQLNSGSFDRPTINEDVVALNRGLSLSSNLSGDLN